MQIPWYTDLDTAEQYAHLAHQYDNRELSEQEFGEALVRLPGYPPQLGAAPPRPGDWLRIVIVPRRTVVAVPGLARRTLH